MRQNLKEERYQLRFHFRVIRFLVEYKFIGGCLCTVDILFIFGGVSGGIFGGVLR